MTAYPTTMSFSDLITEVATGSNRFTSGQNSQCARWIQYVYGRTWSLENWNFRHGVVNNCTVTPGTVTLGGLPADLGTTSAVYADNGQRLMYLGTAEFFDLYSAGTVTGQPMHYTVVNGSSIYLGPTPSVASSTYRLMYEKAPTQLTNDADIPSLPSAFHYMLVPGALALGLSIYNDFTYQFMESQYQAALASMRLDYLADTYGEISQSGAFRPEPWRNNQTQWG